MVNIFHSKDETKGNDEGEEKSPSEINENDNDQTLHLSDTELLQFDSDVRLPSQVERAVELPLN